MKRPCLLLLVCLLILQQAQAQSVLWQKRFSWEGTDKLTDVISLGDSTFLAIGDCAPFSGTSIVRFTAQGDTLYRATIPIQRAYVQQYQLCRLSTGEVYAAALNGSSTTRLVRIDPTDGRYYWAVDLQGVGPQNFSFSVNDMIEGPNGTLILAGRTDDPTGAVANMGYLACYDAYSGAFLWGNEFREHPSSTICNHLELTPENHILVSGMAGSRIWAAELENFGPEIRRATFYQTPTLIYYNYESPSVWQMPNNRYLVVGYTQNYQLYMGVHQGWAGPKIWGGESFRFVRPMQINADGSLVYFQALAPVFHLTKLTVDSLQIWRTTLTQVGTQTNTILYTSAVILDSSGLVVGSSRYQDSTREDWYIARISNMGIPYNPAQPVAIRPAETVYPTHTPPPAARPSPSPASTPPRVSSYTMYKADPASPSPYPLAKTSIYPPFRPASTTTASPPPATPILAAS